MNPAMHQQMHALLSELKYNDKCRVLIITGAGEAFCAGQDLKEYFYLLADDSTKEIRERSRELVQTSGAAICYGSSRRRRSPWSTGTASAAPSRSSRRATSW